MGGPPVNATPLAMILHCPDFSAATRTVDGEFRPVTELIAELLDRIDASAAPRAPDLVVLTGNVAAHARTAEYEFAQEFLTALCDALRLERQRIVVVPGTDDVNQLNCEAYFLRCKADLVAPAPPYWEKWLAFATMIRRFHSSELPKDQPWSLIEYPDLRIMVAGLNSTVAMTHLPQQRHGHLGAEQINWFADRLSAGPRRDWLRIGAVHHRPDGPQTGRLTDAEDFTDTLLPHLDVVLHGRADDPATSLLAGTGAPVLGGGTAWRLLEAYPGRVLVHDLGSGVLPATEAFPLPHPPSRTAPAGRLPAPALSPVLRHLTGQVEKVCRLRFPDDDVTLVAQPGATRVAYLRITPDPASSDRGPVEQHPVGICVATPTAEDIEWFAGVLARFRSGGAVRQAVLVHTGPAAGEDLVKWAADERGVVLRTFADYQVGDTLKRFAASQAAWLARDRVYPSTSYVPQRYTELLRGPRGHSSALPADDLLTWLRQWVDAPRGRLVVVLGTFGHGKTFLLRELARRMHADGSRTIPVLIDLRGFERAMSLDALVAIQFSRHGQRKIDLDALRYLWREGRVALLFDGFDELAARVSYDRATTHLDTIVQAAEGHAKVILTSRDQHFLTDNDVFRELGPQFGAEHQVVRLTAFDDAQILDYLTRQLHDESSAQTRLSHLRSVKDLLSLSRNPRMLSFITELGDEALGTAESGPLPLTPAGLYQRVIERWLDHESERLTRLGVNSPRRPQLLTAVTRLAFRLWDSPEDSLSLRDLDATAAAIAQVAAAPPGASAGLEPQESAHLLGSSTLLVRAGEGRFTFVHHSIREWLIARSLADDLPLGGSPSGMIGHSMPRLMIEFLCQMAGHDFMEDWAKRVLSNESHATGIAQNALEIINYLRAPFERLRMSGADLRGKDFTGSNLAYAEMIGSILAGVPLVGATLDGADLTEANLTGARLDAASLRGVKLYGADLTGAKLLGADLTGATLTRVRLRRAAMVAATGTDLDELRAADTLGAALPDAATAEPQIASSSTVNAVAVCHGLRLLAGGGEDGVVRLWDTTTGTPLRMLPGHTGPVRAVTFTTDGRFLASAGDDPEVRVWDIATGHTVQTFTGHIDRIRSLAYSPDGRHLAGAGDDEMIRIWDTVSGRTVHTLSGHYGGIRGIAYRPRDGRMLASAGDDETVRIWDTVSGRTVHTLIGHIGTVHAIAYAPNGEQVASASDDRQIHIWDVARQQVVRTLTGHNGWIRTVAYSADGRRLASGDDDGSIRIWDNETGQEQDRLAAHSTNVYSIAFFQDGPLLASSGSDRTVQIWDSVAGRLSRTVRHSAGDSRALCFSPRRDDPWLAVGSDDGSVRIWTRVAGNPPRLLSEGGDPESAVRALAVSADAHYLAGSGEDGAIRIWDLTTATMAGPPLTGHVGPVRAIAFTPDGRLLASGGTDGTIRLWDVRRAGAAKAFAAQPDAITSIAFTPDGKHLASGGNDGTVRVWPLGPGTKQIAIRHPSKVRAIAFSPDGRYLASADRDGTIKIRSTVAGDAQHVLSGHSGAVNALAFAPDGSHLASAGTDGTIQIWTADTGELVATLPGRSGWIHSLSFSPDGRRLASTGDDRAVRLWDTLHHELRAVLIPLSAGGSAVLLDNGRYVLKPEQTSDEYWYTIGMCRFEPGELDPYLSELARVPPGARLW
ncbi:pentapeptide repeat-containing protein [Actinoplanes sp. NPDC024001]|uniref:WD40 domain-containing protein n=1 Tax=Actinoplanes sp. NPDC024001 TaxID=3154598 RepID=UPI0033DBEA7C